MAEGGKVLEFPAPANRPRLADDLSPSERAAELLKWFFADKSALTQKNYERDLQAFAAWLGASSIRDAICQLTENSSGYAHSLVFAYQGHMLNVRIGEGENRQIGYAPNTIYRRLVVLKSVLLRARKIGIIDWELDVKLKKPKVVRDTAGPGPEVYAQVLASVEDAIARATAADDARALQIALRDRVLLRLLHDSGLRRAEAVSIEWPLGVRLEQQPSVQVLGKGDRRHQWVPISRACAAQIAAYLDARGRQAGYLLCGTGAHSTARMAPSTVNRRIAHWAKVAGVPFTPHGLRHTAVTSALNAEKGDKRVVKQWSRHQAESSLDAYDDRRRGDNRRITEALSDPSKAEPHS